MVLYMGKVKKICGMFWACNYSNYKPFLPQKQNKEPKEIEFQNLLDAEIKRLKEEQK